VGAENADPIDLEGMAPTEPEEGSKRGRGLPRQGLAAKANESSAQSGNQDDEDHRLNACEAIVVSLAYGVVLGHRRAAGWFERV
jgi:hypothetical protein